MYIGLHVQYRYVYRSACTVPLCISVCMYSTVMYIGLHVQCRYSCQILMRLEFSRQIFEKNFEHQVSWKSVQCEPSCFMRTDEHDTGNYAVSRKHLKRNLIHNSVCSKIKASTKQPLYWPITVPGASKRLGL